MYKKIIAIISSLMIALTMMATPIHAASVNTSGDGFNITFTIATSTVSGTITGKYSSGASIKVVACYRNVKGHVSTYVARTSSPYVSISLSSYPNLNGYATKSWHSGYAVGYPTSLPYGVYTQELTL